VKSQWAQRYKLDSNLAIEKSLAYKKRTFDKRHTKGAFSGTEFKTNAGCWIRDRDWKYKVN
jgi:hypothetical protein